MASDGADIDFLVSQLSIQNFRPIRSKLYAALKELREKRSDLAAVERECDEAKADQKYWEELWMKAANGVLGLQGENEQLRSRLAELEREAGQ